MKINFPPLNTWLNNAFIPLWDNRDRYLILYGSRGSSKSDFIAKMLIVRCLSEVGFKCIVIRKTFASIKDSSYATLKDAIEQMGLNELFELNKTSLQITCKSNGNIFLFRGMDEPDKIKSIREPSMCWFEEDIPESQQDYETISTSIRSSKAEYLQEIFTINPVLEDFENHWFWKRFFKDETDLSFKKSIELKVRDRFVYLSATIHHSTYKDNRWLSDDFIASMENLKNSDPYLYGIYNLGVWTPKIPDGQFYKAFKMLNNTVDSHPYDPKLPLHLSFDFNVYPFVTCLVFQVVGKKCYLIKEFCLKSPNNSTKALCQAIKREYPLHTAGMFIYGDASGRHQDTRSEYGHNDYSIIFEELSQYKPSDRVPKSNPSVVMRGNFINDVFANKTRGIELIISQECKNTINDLMFLKEASDGTKDKTKVRDKVNKTTYEKYGHCSDCLDYFITMCFSSDWKAFGTGGSIFSPVIIKRKSRFGSDNY